MREGSPGKSYELCFFFIKTSLWFLCREWTREAKGRSCETSRGHCRNPTKVSGLLDLDGMVAMGWRELEGVEMFLGRLYKVWGWIASAYVGRREREGAVKSHQSRDLQAPSGY